MHEAAVPEIDSDRIDELIEVRMTRQKLIERDPPLVISSIIDEAALHRAVGGAATMRKQLERLIELAKLPTVTIRIIPFSAGAHMAMDSTFRILDFNGSVPDVVYVEGLAGYFYLDRAQDVERYDKVFKHLSEVALTPQESVELIAQIDVLYENASV